MCGYVPQCACGGQKTTSWDWSSPSSYTWVPEIELGGWACKAIALPGKPSPGLVCSFGLVGWFLFCSKWVQVRTDQGKEIGEELTSRLPTGSFYGPRGLIKLKSEMCKDNGHSRMLECRPEPRCLGFTGLPLHTYRCS